MWQHILSCADPMQPETEFLWNGVIEQIFYIIHKNNLFVIRQNNLFAILLQYFPSKINFFCEV